MVFKKKQFNVNGQKYWLQVCFKRNDPTLSLLVFFVNTNNILLKTSRNFLIYLNHYPTIRNKKVSVNTMYQWHKQDIEITISI